MPAPDTIHAALRGLLRAAQNRVRDLAVARALDDLAGAPDGAAFARVARAIETDALWDSDLRLRAARTLVATAAQAVAEDSPALCYTAVGEAARKLFNECAQHEFDVELTEARLRMDATVAPRGAALYPPKDDPANVRYLADYEAATARLRARREDVEGLVAALLAPLGRA